MGVYAAGSGAQGEPAMNAFYQHHKDSIRFGYRCFDRIDPAQRADPAVSAARAGGRLFWHLPPSRAGLRRNTAWRRYPSSRLITDFGLVRLIHLVPGIRPNL